jgi:hypothetical protein
VSDPIDGPTEQKAPEMVIRWQNGTFQTSVDPNIPMMPLMGILALQLVSLGIQQLQEVQRQQMQERVREVARGKQLFMPDGSPYPGNT